MTRALKIVERALHRRRAGLVLLGIVAAAYATAYVNHPLFPGFATSEVARGWWTWTDQSRYLAESQAIARLQLDASTYFYPVGYPVLGAVFGWWMPANPFFVPNLLLVMGAATMWWQLAQRWLSRTAALLAGLLFLATHGWLIAYTMVVPWNTIATQCTLLGGIWIALEVRNARAVWWLAALAALTYFVRPVDAAAFGPLLVFATLRLSSWRERILTGAGGVALIGAAVVAVGSLNLLVVGQWRTIYEIVSTQTIGFFGYPISHKLYWLFVDGQPLFGETERALLFRYPWLFLAAPAGLFLIQKERMAGVAVLSAILLNLLLYVNYNDLLPSDIYRFTLIHYISWVFPLGWLLAVAACGHARSAWVRIGFLMTAAALAVCVGLRLEPRSVEVAAVSGGSCLLPPQRPLLIQFPGASMDSLPELRLDGRRLVEYSEYLVPYVPSDLQLLLGKYARGVILSLDGGRSFPTRPVVSEYAWTWSLAAERLPGVP